MILSTPPLAPSVIKGLNQINVFTVADLCELNPCSAFLLLKQQGLSVTQSVFWQLVALCEQTAPQHLSEQQKHVWSKTLQAYPPVAVFPPKEIMMNFMNLALEQARQAACKQEIPVGAVLVHENQLVAQAHNLCVAEHSVCRHAEIQVIEQAGKILQNYRLNDCDLYVTLEPCAMCAGAIVQSRIRRLIFAAHEPKMGAAGSVFNLFENKKLNPHTAVYSGILAQESRDLLQDFFAQRRKNQAA